MSVRVLAFFDSRYQTSPLGTAEEAWRPLKEARPVSRQHFALDAPSSLGMYDLGDPQAAAAVVASAKSANIEGFVVDLRWTAQGYWTGAEALAPLTGPDFGLAFQWKNGDDAFWTAEASVEERAARAQTMIKAISVGTPALIGGRVGLMVESPKLLQGPAEALRLLRAAAAEAGLPGLYLMASRAEDAKGDYLKVQGYDALVDPSVPAWPSCPPNSEPNGLDYLEVMAGLKDSVEYTDRFYNYMLFTVARMINRDKRGKVLPRVFAAYYDWLEKPEGGGMHLQFKGGGRTAPNDPHYFSMFVENAMLWAQGNLPEDEQVVFMDSWNGWATGSQIEPSLLDGELITNAARNGIDRGRFMAMGRASMPKCQLDADLRERIKLLCEAASNL